MSVINSVVDKDGNLVLTIALSKTPTQSKSAIAKAIKDKVDPSTVPATMLATTGGFTRCGNFKVSLNVMTGA